MTITKTRSPIGADHARAAGEAWGQLPRGANGRLPLDLAKSKGWGRGWLRFETILIGGPYRACPDDMPGVCLLEVVPEVRAVSRTPNTAVDQACAVHLPIEDFNVPDDPAAVTLALQQTLRLMIAGETVYVGCAGGWGRTGLFLSLLAKVAGEPDPVGYVRRHYTPRAVETARQQQFIDRFDPAPLQRWLFWPLLWRRLWAFVGR